MPAHITKILSAYRDCVRDQWCLGEPPTDENVQDFFRLNVPEWRVLRKAVAASRLPTYLGSRVSDVRAVEPNAELVMGSQDLSEVLAHCLDDRSLFVLSCRFGLNGQIEHTLEETGARLGVTRERVRQIEKAALDELREYLNPKVEDTCPPTTSSTTELRSSSTTCAESWTPVIRRSSSWGTSSSPA